MLLWGLHDTLRSLLYDSMVVAIHILPALCIKGNTDPICHGSVIRILTKAEITISTVKNDTVIHFSVY